MTRRPSRAGRSRDGLFWSPTGADGEVQDNPLLRPCAHCRAAPRQACTRPGRGGRIEIKGFHDSRKITEPEFQIRREIGDYIDGVLLSEPGIPGADIAAWICTHYVIRERPRP